MFDPLFYLQLTDQEYKDKYPDVDLELGKRVQH